ncbi:CRISPR-associated protein Cas7/Cst2/DevR, subtype I-B/TNEAP [Leptospira inadai serovar Lyme str. 10]|uniref:CRISPR-associated protein Cas7/Cst2/DevR, subtype I-B/TNEAP n=2 Tax=Leptospira inadai serovar Lyme TaxID=293084 RepID=V6HBE1_9LEPT|nr:type I-B CRISPR-associated protein Cas7/Cst2/DevR [Leptospira inadai]EQA36727.1 CRISPR-associated protein Cas7/Cst2/DevR, subtype I-B/TNEAP [Leptospira inadai serovar Lyme str. 10]PNV75477.1 type I-B CRISPR-associated protein Cas7/Cst2/DevR [Leptospira inadai serovar Lyme]
MAFISGIQIIHAPASALNNAGNDPSASTQNATAVKFLRVGGKQYPYVSAQAYRYWIRKTLEETAKEWTISPIFREKKVAYTDANPIEYCDDDILGYMRAPGKKAEAEGSRAEFAKNTETKETVTRVSPFRVGTLVALSPGIDRDFGTMSRHEGDPVPYEHQFYRSSLFGMFSLDLGSAGVFGYKNRTGFLNLDETRVEIAKKKKLKHDEKQGTYALDDQTRIERISHLLRAMAVVEGGAKQALHYTDVTPAVVIAAVTKGGNNPFQFLVQPGSLGEATPNFESFEETAKVWKDTILSPLYIGWVKGYSSEGRKALEGKLEELNKTYPHGIVLEHPKTILETIASSIQSDWLK